MKAIDAFDTWVNGLIAFLAIFIVGLIVGYIYLYPIASLILFVMLVVVPLVLGYVVDVVRE